jgi:hypothetical protein
VLTVNENFVHAGTKTFEPNVSGLQAGIMKHMFTLANSGQLERLDKATCVKEDGHSYQSARGSVLLVRSNDTSGFDDDATAV